MKHEHINEIKAIVILAVGLILFASFVSFVPGDLAWYTSNPNKPTKNLISVVGAYAAGGCFFVFGYSAYALVVFMFFWSWNKFTSREIDFTAAKLISSIVLLCVLSGLFGIFGVQEAVMRFQRAGVVGVFLSDFLITYTGGTGSYIILFTLAVLTTILIGEFLISPFLLRATGTANEFIGTIPERIQEQLEIWMSQWTTREKTKKEEQPSFLDRWKAKQQAKSGSEDEEDVDVEEYDESDEEDEEEYDDEEYEDEEEEDEDEEGEDYEGEEESAAKPSIRITGEQRSKKASAAKKPKSVGNYTIPSLDLLEDSPQISARDLENDLVSGAKVLEETLADFNVAARVADIERGPVITRYELQPAPGVKVNKITTLADDIALAMRAPSVRIVAPIPGKNRVGIEVPNGAKASVFLKDVLSQPEYQNAKSKLMLALGKDIAGKPMIFDLSEMPHLLIAGTTGAGKTVCVNSLIMSLLFHASPDEVKLLMVDPKMVELTQYNGLPHCLCPAVTDPKKVSSALNWVVGEMESRYQTLSQEGVRNIKGYHAKGGEMPYIVIIIDELADLMQVSAKTIESAITRLAQLSRAVGIHLVLATQRPSVDVITGVIKANFPARVSFKVASKVDSRTVLDMNGAENLLGRGDMLFIKPGDAKPTRGQCSFVQDNEIDKVISFIKGQQEPDYDEEILRHRSSSGAGGVEEKDELYDEAVQLVVETNQASVSIIQRRMRLGYTRAARLIDMMEQEGIVGPYCGSKPRDILVDREEWMLKNMKNRQEGNS